MPLPAHHPQHPPSLQGPATLNISQHHQYHCHHHYHITATAIAIIIAIIIVIIVVMLNDAAFAIYLIIAIAINTALASSHSTQLHHAIASALQPLSMAPQGHAPVSVPTDRTTTRAVNKPPSTPSPSLTNSQNSPGDSTDDAEHYKQATIALSMCVAVLSLALTGLVALFIYRRCTFRTTTRRVPSAKSRSGKNRGD